MDTRGSVLPPDVVISSEYLYAIQGDIFALRKSDGELHRRYPIQGISRLTTLKDILYINVNHLADASVQAMHENGTQLWNTK